MRVCKEERGACALNDVTIAVVWFALPHEKRLRLMEEAWLLFSRIAFRLPHCLHSGGIYMRSASAARANLGGC